MPIEFKTGDVFFRDVASVEEAEGLLEWLQKNPSAKVDLSTCTHLHAANLQVLMAAKPDISFWPEDAKLRAWLETVLPFSADKEEQKPRAVEHRKREITKTLHSGKVPGSIFDSALGL